MAYKFQFGPTTLSGSTTFEESLIGGSTISGSGRISGKELILDAAGVIGTSGDVDLLTLTPDTLTVAGAVTATNVNVGGALNTVSSLDATTESTIEAAIDTLANLTSFGDTGVETRALGSLDVVGAIQINNTNFADASRNLTVGTVGCGAVTATGHLSSSLGLSGSSLFVHAEGGGTGNAIKLMNGLVSGSGGLSAAGTTSIGNGYFVFSDATMVAAGALHVSGTFAPEEAMTAVKLAQDGMLYFDSGSGTVHRSSLVDVASSMAGTGITAAAGVLSVDTTGGDSMTSTLINAIQAANDGFTLSTGMNYLVAGVTGSSVVTLPSGSSGDVVIVKAGLITGAGNLKISSSLANGNQIDGFSEARIESSYGAVSLVYTVRAGDAHGDWVIY